MTRIHHDVAEELLEAIWVLGERGPVTPRQARAACHVRAPAEALQALEREGLISLSDDRIQFTSTGRAAAAFVIRRQRLGEILALEVMGFEHQQEKRAVCEFEHVIGPDDIDRVCTQLGHPTLCPDGEPIPRGRCCVEGGPPGPPSVIPLSEAKPGDRGRVLYLRRTEAGRVRTLQSHGLLGGARFFLRQRRPALVLQVEEVEVAIDVAVAEDVFVLLDAD